jgi:hypothetical protein
VQHQSHPLILLPVYLRNVPLHHPGHLSSCISSGMEQ